ncbi:MAG: vWA domain-containing protein [Myxococcota bacterium]
MARGGARHDRRRAGWLLLAMVPWLGSCASPSDETGGLPASIAVDVYGGIGGPNPAGPALPKRVHVVMDVTASMLEQSPDGARHVDAAQGEAAQLLYSLGEGTEIAVSAFGNRESQVCVAAERVVAPVVPERREPLVQRMQDLPPLSEGSLSEAIESVREDLIRDAAASRTRVVVFTDLDGSCGGDLCRAAESLVEEGAWLEIVTLGNAVPPACLASLRPAIAPPVAGRFGYRAKPPGFRVERARAGRGRPELLGEGHAGEGPVMVAAGLVTVVLDLDPPEEIGPFLVEPGSFARVRLLNAFDAALPTRVWRVEKGVGPLIRAFPPSAAPPRPTKRGGLR